MSIAAVDVASAMLARRYIQDGLTALQMWSQFGLPAPGTAAYTALTLSLQGMAAYLNGLNTAS